MLLTNPSLYMDGEEQSRVVSQAEISNPDGILITIAILWALVIIVSIIFKEDK